MATILSYLIEYESSHGDLREAEVDVDYNDDVASHHNALDETARRHIIATILKEGGRVIKIVKVIDNE